MAWNIGSYSFSWIENYGQVSHWATGVGLDKLAFIGEAQYRLAWT